MADVVDSATRSRMMAGIKAKDTQPEVRLRRALHAMGFRFRVHDRRLPGTPDIVLPKWRAAIQVHGCFWHRHAGCRYSTTPATRPEFWMEKFSGNIARDERNLAALHAAGWRVAIVWECSLRTADLSNICGQLADWLRSGAGDFQMPAENLSL